MVANRYYSSLVKDVLNTFKYKYLQDLYYVAVINILRLQHGFITVFKLRLQTGILVHFVTDVLNTCIYPIRIM